MPEPNAVHAQAQQDKQAQQDQLAPQDQLAANKAEIQSHWAEMEAAWLAELAETEPQVPCADDGSYERDRDGW